MNLYGILCKWLRPRVAQVLMGLWYLLLLVLIFLFFFKPPGVFHYLAGP